MYINLSKRSHNWQDCTLILPAVAIGNIGQLAIDLLLSTLNSVKIGSFYDEALMFLVGNDPYGKLEDGQCNLVTGMDVYECVEKKLIIVQQRVPVLQAKRREFRKKLIDWMKSCQFKKVILLSSSSTHARKEFQLPGFKLRFLNTPTLEENLESLLNWSRLEPASSEGSNNDTDVYIPGGGLTKQIYQDCCKENIPLCVLILLCSEGDNKPEAVALASYLNDWLQLTEKPTDSSQDMWKFPSSWQHLFGNTPPLTLY